MKNALFELSYADQYDFLIVNESFDAAIEELLEIIKDTQRIDSHREEKINLLKELLSWGNILQLQYAPGVLYG